MSQIVGDKKNVKRLLLGRSISLLGSGIYLICLPLYILDLTHSLAASGLYFAVVALPALVFTIPLGVWCERINHRLLLIGCDITSGILFILLFILAITKQMSLPVLMGFGMMLSFVDVVFGIVSNVLFTELNDVDSLESMNGLKSIFDNSVNLCAPMIGTLLYAWIGFYAVLLVNAISFLLSALQESFIVYEPISQTQEKHNTLHQLTEGFRYVIHAKKVLPMFILVMVLNFFVAPSEEVYYPGMVKFVHQISDSWYGFISVAFIAGTLVAGVLVYRLKNTNWQKRLYPLFIMSSIVMGSMGLLSYFTMDWQPIYFYALFLLLAVGSGFLTSLVNIPLMAGFQRDVELSYQSRFFAMLQFSSRLLIPLGMTYAGYLSEQIRPDTAYVIQNGIVIVIIVIIMIMQRSKLKQKVKI